MSVFYQSLITSVIIAMLSLIGVITFFLKDRILKKILLFFVSFSAGALLGGAFFHLLPESLEEFGNPITIFTYTIIGFSMFFVLERILRWHHCHDVDCDTHGHLGYLNLFGDGVHNLIDGMIIFSSFSVSTPLGIAVAISIVLHEIPQEIGDFGVLLYAGFSKRKALLYNLITASTVIVGVILGSLLLSRVEGLNNFLLPFAAGGFIYISASVLIPEIHKERSLKKSVISFLIFVIAIIFMLILAR